MFLSFLSNIASLTQTSFLSCICLSCAFFSLTYMMYHAVLFLVCFSLSSSLAHTRSLPHTTFSHTSRSDVSLLRFINLASPLLDVPVTTFIVATFFGKLVVLVVLCVILLSAYVTPEPCITAQSTPMWGKAALLIALWVSLVLCVCYDVSSSGFALSSY